MPRIFIDTIDACITVYVIERDKLLQLNKFTDSVMIMKYFPINRLELVLKSLIYI